MRPGRWSEVLARHRNCHESPQRCANIAAAPYFIIPFASMMATGTRLPPRTTPNTERQLNRQIDFWLENFAEMFGSVFTRRTEVAVDRFICFLEDGRLQRPLRRNFDIAGSAFTSQTKHSTRLSYPGGWAEDWNHRSAWKYN